MCVRHVRGHRLRPTRARRRHDSPPSPFLLLLALIFLFSFFSNVYAGKDYYDILGVSRDADASTIKRAFRKLAMKYHPGTIIKVSLLLGLFPSCSLTISHLTIFKIPLPCSYPCADKNPGNKEAEKRYLEANNAYEVLTDNSKRQKYDRWGEDGLKGGSDFDMEDDFNPFGDFFGHHRRRREERRVVPDVVVPFSVSLEMLYNGAVREITHKKRVICSSWSDCERKCTKCGGRGMVIQTRRLGPGFVQQIQTQCPDCGGSGKISNPQCKSCPNGQFEQVEKQLLLDIEKGMADGQMITFDGETDEVPEHHPGSVKFEIDSQNHSQFERVGNDLYYKLTITLSEALVGVNRVVRQLDGRKVSIETDSVVTPRDQIVIKGEGMPIYDTDEAGDMIVDFWVEFPKSLTEEQKKAAIALHGERPTLEETGDGTKNATAWGTDDDEKTEL